MERGREEVMLDETVERYIGEECQAQQGDILVLSEGGGLSPSSQGPAR